jgi:uncharacterized protein involved in outer membrane biogenesis
MRLLKIVGWILGGILVLAAAAAGALWIGGGPALAWALQHPVSSMIGRQIRIDGPLTVRWGAPTRIVAENVHVANASWGSEPEMFSAQRLEIDLFARTLVFGPTRIPLISLDGAKLLLETSDQGARNWDFSAKAAAPKKRGQFPDLERFVVHDSALTYRNGETKAQTELGLASLEIDAPNPQSQVQIAATGSFQKAPAQLAATVGPLSALRDTSNPYPVKLEGALDQVRFAVDGTIQEPLDLAGLDLRLSLRGAKLHELGSLLGVPMPELPDFRSTTKLTGGNGNWELKALTIALGKSDLEGGIAIDTTGKVPYIKADLTSNTLDLADAKGAYGGKPANSSAAPARQPDPSGRVIPDTPIAVHKLPGLNADLAFDGTRIVAPGGLPVERVSLGLHLKDGAITVEPLRFQVALGSVDLNLRFTPFTRAGPPHLQGAIDIRRIDLHKLLDRPTMPAALRETAGTVGGFVKLDTSGVSLREFLARMNGDAGIFMENGQFSALLQELAPLNVLGALGVYVSGDRPVPIECLVSRFDIKDGVATATTLLFQTANTTVVGAGNINFASETIYLTLTPYNRGVAPISLRTPVDVQGTFAKPTYHLHTGKLIARLGAAVGLGVLFPPAALLPLVDVGLGDQNACRKAFAAQPEGGEPASGSSR